MLVHKLGKSYKRKLIYENHKLVGTVHHRIN